MLTHPSVSKIKHVMETDPVAVKTDTPIDDLTLDFEKYDLVAMPVVDLIGRLVGQITVDDVMDEAREQSERDYQLASGLSGDVESDDTLFTQTKARLPWLLIGILGGIGNSLILGNFEGAFAVNPAMALFIPLIGGTGGNVGIQSSAIIVQGLANGSLDVKSSAKQIFKELGVGLLNASIISLLVFVYNVFALGPTQVTTIAVSLSLFAVVVFSFRIRHIRASDPREIQNRSGPCDRPVHLHHQRHYRHGNLYAYLLVAPGGFRHGGMSKMPDMNVLLSIIL